MFTLKRIKTEKLLTNLFEDKAALLFQSADIRQAYVYNTKENAIKAAHNISNQINEPLQICETFNDNGKLSFFEDCLVCFPGFHHSIQMKNENAVIRYSRGPTNAEIKQGYGARHYLDVPMLDAFNYKTGEFKQRLKLDGLTYTKL